MNKIQFGDRHHQINGIEVFLATKTSGQIGFRINRRVKFVANGTKKAKASLFVSAWDAQRVFDHYVSGDVITEAVKLLAGKMPCNHVKLPDRVWVLS